MNGSEVFQLLLELYSHRKQNKKLNWLCWRDIYLEGKFHFTGRSVITQKPVHWIKTLNKPQGWLSPSETSNSHTPHVPAQIKPWAQPDRQRKNPRHLQLSHCLLCILLLELLLLQFAALLPQLVHQPRVVLAQLVQLCRLPGNKHSHRGLLLKCQHQVLYLQPKGCTRWVWGVFTPF